MRARLLHHPQQQRARDRLRQDDPERALLAVSRAELHRADADAGHAVRGRGEAAAAAAQEGAVELPHALQERAAPHGASVLEEVQHGDQALREPDHGGGQ